MFQLAKLLLYFVYYESVILSSENKTKPLEESITHEKIDTFTPRIVSYTEGKEIYRNFVCGLPQQRAIDSFKFIENIAPEETISPIQTSLHQCARDTGICRSTATTCSVISNKTVELVFQIHNAVTKTVRYQKIEAVNHTACGCI